ncbi:MAG: sulfurtransferase [Syntrophobacteraceae bacterium]|nr:sulfurtransferase [Syntrophobacteraceae bacterium]
MKPSTEASELRALLRRDPDAVMVIDVRRRRDFEGDSRLISAAQWRDPEAVDTWSKDLGRDRPVVVYCVRGGSVSQTVSARLAERGVPVKYLEGGLAAWDLSRETI